MRRRTMNQALQKFELPPEAVALIREGRTAPQAIAPVISAEPASLPAKEPKQNRPRKVRGGSVEASSSTNTNPEPTEVRSVSRSFRLPENLLVPLLRASTERRIERRRPFTQEEMVTEAIRDWLMKNKLL
jgi:hypothetical protein